MGNKAAKNDMLYEASSNGDLRSVKKLIKAGADPNATGGNVMWTALIVAAYRGHSSVAAALIQAGADVARAAEDGQTPLIVAAGEGHSSIVEELLKNKLSKIDAVDEKGETALLKAASKGHTHTATVLVKAGANVNMVDTRDGMSALAWASEHGPSSLVSALISAGADVNAKNHNGQTPLICAAAKSYTYDAKAGAAGGLRLSQSLYPGVVLNASSISISTAPNATEGRPDGNDEGSESSPSSAAAPGEETKQTGVAGASSSSSSNGARGGHASLSTRESGPASVVQCLIQAGANINAKNHDGYTALMVSCWQGHSAVVDCLVMAKADLNAKAEKGQTALMMGSAQGHSSIVELMLKEGAEWNAADEKGETALLKASAKGHSYIVDCLIRAGASVNVKDTIHGNSALMWACINRHSAIVDSLLKSGALVNAKNHKGESALIHSAAKGHPYTTELLITAGAEVNAQDDVRGDSPLILAAGAGSDSVVEALLESGARVNHKNHDGQTALFRAIAKHHISTMEFLVAAGADVNAKDNLCGKSAIEYTKDISAQRNALLRGVEQHKRRSGRSSTATSGSSSGSSGGNGSGGPYPAVDRSAKDSAAPSIAPSTGSGAGTTSNPTAPGGANTNTNTGTGAVPVVGRSVSGDTSNEGKDHHPDDIKSWGVAEVKAWLHSIALPQYVDAFQEASVDGEMLVELASDNEELLQNEVGVRKRIHRMKIIREIKKLTSSRTGVGAPLDTVEDETSGDTTTLAPPSHGLPRSVPPSPHSGPMLPLPRKHSSSTTPSHTPHHGNVTHLRAPSNGIIDHHSSSSSSSGSFSLAHNGHHTPNGNNGNGLLRQSTGSSSIVMSDNVADDEAERIRLMELEKEREQQERDRLYTKEHPLQFDNNGGVSDLLSSLGINKPLGAGIGMGMDDGHGHHEDSVPPRPAGLIPIGTDSRQSSTGSSGLPGSLTPAASTNGFHSSPVISGGMTAVRLMSSISGGSQSSNGNGGSGGVNPTGFPDLYDGGRTSAVESKRIPEPRQIPYSELVIKEEIGRGQFGTVYVATWRGAPVAVKKLHSQNLSAEQLAHFIREAGIMELLGNHPNVVRFCGVCVTRPNLCIVTQYFVNGSLENLLIKREPKPSLDLRTLVSMAKDIASGILHLHMEGVIHRDLAVRNLLVDDNMSVRVADFGMSRIKQASVGHTNSSVGPLKWMSPEAIVKQQYSEKSDAFSFGVCLWEILFRQQPYPGFHDLEAALKVSHDESFRPPLPAELPHAIATLMTDCWQMDPANRPNFREIHSRLQRFLNTYNDAAYASLPEWSTYYTTSPAGTMQLSRFNEIHALPAPSYSTSGVFTPTVTYMHGLPSIGSAAATWLQVNSSQSALASLIASSSSSSQSSPATAPSPQLLTTSLSSSSSSSSSSPPSATTSLLHPSILASLTASAASSSSSDNNIGNGGNVANDGFVATQSPAKPRVPTLILPPGVSPATPPSSSPYDSSDRLGITDSPPKTAVPLVAS